ncbi:helix-turn-helix transcriptional regulator [bacterium]|nr:helix-turn-helix transcriptional regulator [bacterium]
MSSGSDLRSGTLRVLILSELSHGENYGWGIAEAIRGKSGEDLSVRVESLYPILHVFEEKGLVTARWEEGPNGRPRKLYSITQKGRLALEKQAGEFKRVASAVLKVLDSSFAGEGA